MKCTNCWTTGSGTDLGVDRLPLGAREDREAFPHPARHDRSFLEAGTELRGDREPTLLVQGVGELAGEERFQLAFRIRGQMVPHWSPLITTRPYFRSTARACQGMRTEKNGRTRD